MNAIPNGISVHLHGAAEDEEVGNVAPGDNDNCVPECNGDESDKKQQVNEEDCSSDVDDETALTQATLRHRRPQESSSRDCENPAEQDDEDRFRKTCRFVTRFGLAAYRYGSPSSRVEIFLKKLMETFGYGGIFRITNTELFCSFYKDDPFDQVICLLDIKEGSHLHKLAQLNETAKRVINNELSQAGAIDQLEIIEKDSDPWSPFQVFLSFVATGGSLPVVFRGNWWDMLIAAICSVPVFLLSVYLPPSIYRTLPFLCTLISTLIASLVRRFVQMKVHTGLVVLSSVIILIPGYSASMAVSDILSNRITAGLGRLINSILDLALLAGGGWVGAEIVGDLDFAPYDGGSDDAVAPPWLTLFGPILMISLCIQFQTSYHDLPWSIGNLTIAFAGAYTGNATGKANLGVFIASIMVTVYAQAWARWMDRPRSLVLLPSLVLLVSGSIGFRGLVSWTEGDRGLGLEQFVQMFVVALFIIGGLLVGNMFVRANTTL